MKRYLPFAIILVVLLVAVAGGALLYYFRAASAPPPKATFGRPGAEPPHVRGKPNAPIELEEFGDFECLPCFMLWPALKNLEKDHGEHLSITFRQHPLAKHRNARDAARASEAAGLQDRFWDMYDVLYMKRAEWVRSDDVRAYFNKYAADLGLDVERFKADMDGAEVAKRIAADEDRAASLGIDRTPVVYINGKRMAFTPQPEDGLRAEIEGLLAPKAH